MKNSIFSTFAVLMVFTGLQTANAQTKSSTNKEAQQLYQAVLENKADLEEQVRKGSIMVEARKAGKDQQDGIAMPDAKTETQNGVAMPEAKKSDVIYYELINTLEDFFARVEKTGGKMTAAQLAAFKTELAKFETEAVKLESEQTQSLVGASLSLCIKSCKNTYAGFFLAPLRVLCMAGCYLI